MSATGSADPRTLLRCIGDELDQHKKLRVYRGGTVLPSTWRPSHDLLGEELSNERQGDRTGPERSESGSGPGAAEGSTAVARTRRSAASLLRDSRLSAEIIADVQSATDAQKGYSQLRVRLAGPVIWLEGEIEPVKRLDRVARVVVSYPRDASLPVRSWAFWTNGSWIGPRHTNFGDGSICAFEIPDGTWRRELPLVGYLDLVSVWIARHTYLKEFDRWPGRQVLHTAQEQLTEHRRGEICGRCESGRLYERCHRRLDERRSTADVEAEYRGKYRGAIQMPPASSAEFQKAALQRWNMTSQ